MARNYSYSGQCEGKNSRGKRCKNYADGWTDSKVYWCDRHRDVVEAGDVAKKSR